LLALARGSPAPREQNRQFKFVRMQHIRAVTRHGVRGTLAA